MTQLLLIGGGGHCRSCIDVIEGVDGIEIAGIVDENKDAPENIRYPLLGNDDDLAKLLEQFPAAIVTLGQIKTPDVRMRLFDRLVHLGAIIPTIVSTHSYVSASAKIGKGSMVFHGAVVNAHATVGGNCIVNSRALIEHDAHIGAHCHISTGAIVNGGTRVEAGSFVGSGAILREGVTIGERAIIGAGAVVLADVPAGTTIRTNK